MRILYRIGQFWRTLTAKPVDSELQQAREILGPELIKVFLGQQTSEQAHSLKVLRRLQLQGDPPLDLMVAALLHDAGKSRYPLALWERVLIVIGKSAFADKTRIWGKGAPHGWRRPFVVAEQHPGWGADMALEAGASPLAATLIRRHQDDLDRCDRDQTALYNRGDLSQEDKYLIRLQLVDNES